MTDPAAPEPLDGFAPWDGRRVPVTLLGGYLGAGKTTLINELLARTSRPVAVLVNDLGSVNVDAALIARRHGDTIELTDGCICCSVDGDLADALDRLRRRPVPPDHVVIELSGAAEPARVIPWARSDGFRLDGVVVLVDCLRGRALLDDPVIGALVEAQLAAADLLVLTKVDLVPEPAVTAMESLLADHWPHVPRLRSDSPLAAAGFLELGTRHPDGVGHTPPPTLFDAHQATTITLPDPVERAELERIVDGLGPEVLRAKGIARTTAGQRLLIQVVGARRLVTPLPQAEDQPPTDLVVISARR